MPQYHYHFVDVFTDRPFAGNQLAVFTDAKNMPPELMQIIPRELNLSECTYILPPDDPANQFRVRIFTPAKELPIAGHPTIGTAYVLARIGWVPAGDVVTVRLEEAVGVVPVEIQSKGGVLSPVGQVSGLGQGEQIYSVRFVDDTGYVVTYRQVDPLYTIDLSTPTAPKVAGQLELEGYSAYLHPLGDGLLLGVGVDVSSDTNEPTGAQVELFDGIFATGRFPVGIYPTWLRFSVTFLVPIAFAVTVPAEAVTARLGWQTLALAVVFAAVLFGFTRWFWRYGLRSYTGASA